jgi:hypothetical protein
LALVAKRSHAAMATPTPTKLRMKSSKMSVCRN